MLLLPENCAFIMNFLAELLCVTW